MIMTGLAVITAPIWLPIYAVGVIATTTGYIIMAGTFIAIVN